MKMAGSRIVTLEAIEELNRAKAALDAELVRRATTGAGAFIRGTEYVIRDLMPSDLGASTEKWSQSLSADAWNTIYSGKNPDDRAFGIYAILGGISGGTTAIKFFDETARTSTKDLVMVEDLWQGGEAEKAIILDAPPIWDKSRGFNIDFYGANSVIDSIVLRGRVIEPKGKTIVGEKY